MKKYTRINKNKLVKIIICGIGIIGLLIIVLNLLRKTKENFSGNKVGEAHSQSNIRGVGSSSMQAHIHGNPQKQTDVSGDIGTENSTTTTTGDIINNGTGDTSVVGANSTTFSSQPSSQPSSLTSQENKGTDGNGTETEIVMEVTLSGPTGILSQLNIK